MEMEQGLNFWPSDTTRPEVVVNVTKSREQIVRNYKRRLIHEQFRDTTNICNILGSKLA